MPGDSEPTDPQLLSAWRAGNRRAGEQLIRRHFADVHAYFARRAARLHPGLEPGELSQRTFAAVVAARDRVQGEFRPYLFGIARNVLRKAYRELAARMEHVSPSKAHLADPGACASRLFARRQEAARVRAAIADLPEEFRRVLELFYIQGWSVEAIALELSIPRGTVKSRLARGRRHLRARLGDPTAPAR